MPPSWYRGLILPHLLQTSIILLYLGLHHLQHEQCGVFHCAFGFRCTDDHSSNSIYQPREDLRELRLHHLTVLGPPLNGILRAG
jgi:hypothetical protein